MSFFNLARFLLPNAGVSVSEGSNDQTTTAALGQAVENLDTYAARMNGTNTATSAMTLDLSLASDTTGLKLPAKAGAAPTADGFLAFDTTAHAPVAGFNGTKRQLASLDGTETLTNKTLTNPAIGAFTAGTASQIDIQVDGLKSVYFGRSSGSTIILHSDGATPTGFQVGSATGGDKGAGTINVAGDYYTNNVKIPAPAPITNTLGGNVALNNTATYFDGPSVAQGSTGTWFASGSVTIAGVAGDNVLAKLWDGTTVAASAEGSIPSGGSALLVLSLSGFLATPAGNLRISVKDGTSTSALIEANISTNAKDSTITAIRVA